MSSPLPPDVAAARLTLGKSLRQFGHALVGHHADADEMLAAAATLDEFRERFEAGERRSRSLERPSGDWNPDIAEGEEILSFDERPISGRAAPYGLDVSVVRQGREAVGRITFGAAHEGAPGRCHGGIVSALFDDVFGFVLTIEAQAAFTGTLTIRYERGAPVGVPLECRVRLDRREGRKLFMSGELIAPTDDGQAPVFTRATAIFIAIDPARFGEGAKA